MSFEVVLSRTARRALTETLPHAVAASAWEFIDGPLHENPRRVGKPLAGQLAGRWSARRGTSRILSSIDGGRLTVLVLDVRRRADAHRT
ncbi:MAG: type II toxin-antitoxin system RelE/ParE family toxin [Kineosporiaceae bacterium]